MSSIGSIGAGTHASSMASMMRMRPPPGGGDSSSSTFATASSSTTGGAPPGGLQGPPPPPMAFNVDMSTTQFAQSSSMGGIDRDGDGSLSKDELGYDDAGELGQKLFDSIDKDGNGSLSGDEVSAYQDMMAQAMQQAMGGMMGMGGPPPGPPSGEDPIASLDSDGDGSVSSSEFGITSDSTDAMKALFSAFDSDGDDSLSSGEINAFKEKMTEAMPASPQGGRPPPSAGGQDVSAFLEQLAKQYASLSSSSSDSSVSLMS